MEIIVQCYFKTGFLLFLLGLTQIFQINTQSEECIQRTIVYSLEPIKNILLEIAKLNSDGSVASIFLDSALCELQEKNSEFHSDTIRLVLQQAWNILEKFHEKVETSLLLDWYGKLVAFSLECGIQDR